MSKQWVAKTWSGLTSFDGNSIWKDGDNIYYSWQSDHYVLNKATSTWASKTWSGAIVSSFNPVYTWTDGTDIYYSEYDSQYVLNKSTGEWVAKTWNISDLRGMHIWTDGDNIYYSFGASNQYVLNKSTGEWETKTWNGFTYLSGNNIWTDGNTIYYSNYYEDPGSDPVNQQYVLDKATSTWSQKTWNINGLSGPNVWNEGEHTYYSNGLAQYELNKSTSEWETKDWGDFNPSYGFQIWNDGDNIYYSQSTNQYAYAEPQPTVNYLSKLVIPVNVSGTISNVEYTFKDAEARQMVIDLGDTLYWIGVTTTELTDGDTTNPITVGGESVTADVGGMASYDGSEFVWNGTSWQELGKNNFGDLAFKDSASGDFTPAGTVNVTQAADTTTDVTPFGTAGTLPTAYFTLSGENVTFNWNAGTRPTGGTAVSAVTASGTVSATFTGTEGELTAE